MSRLIDADKLIEQLEESKSECYSPSDMLCNGQINRDIILVDYAPTIEERKKGEWIYTQYDGNANIGNWHCSECRHIVYGGYSQKPYYNYCPNCGADMRGDAE